MRTLSDRAFWLLVGHMAPDVAQAEVAAWLGVTEDELCAAIWPGASDEVVDRISKRLAGGASGKNTVDAVRGVRRKKAGPIEGDGAD